MRIPSMPPSKLTEVEVDEVDRKREDESRCFQELMMRLQTMISLSQCEESNCPKSS
jgi:hypothetical protein